MTVINGLPAHALLLHLVVVLVPLTALLEILCGLWPAARRGQLLWLTLVLAAATMNIDAHHHKRRAMARPPEDQAQPDPRTCRAWQHNGLLLRRSAGGGDRTRRAALDRTPTRKAPDGHPYRRSDNCSCRWDRRWSRSTARAMQVPNRVWGGEIARLKKSNGT